MSRIRQLIETQLNGMQRLAVLVLLAILLRLILMPFFLHMDLLSEFKRVNYAVENLSFYPGFNRIITFWIECAFYSITQLFVVNEELLLFLPDPLHSTSTTTQHFIFAGDPHIFRHLFVFKIPYLVFDLLSAWLIWQYFKGSTWRNVALLLWLFNPVTIYASYVFGRFEIISIFFLITTALSLKQHRVLLAALCFGLALNCREVNIIFVPAFLLALYHFLAHSQISKKRILLAFAIVVSLWQLPQIIESLTGAEPLFSGPTKAVDIDRGITALTAGKFAGVYPFFLLFGIAAFVLLSRVSNETYSAHEAFVAAGASTVAAFFVTGFHSAHYFAWIMPFLVLLLYQREGLLLPIIALIACWFSFWMMNPEGAYFTPLLATPIHESLFGWGNFAQVYQGYFKGHALLDVANIRTLIFTFSVACLIVIAFRALSLSAPVSEKK